MKILFVCHGNICRSVMEEYVFKYIDKDNEYYCESRATSLEEIGNDIYPPIKDVLLKNNIPFSKHSARQITINDYNKFDLIICNDYNNIRNLKYMIEDKDNKIVLFNEYINEDSIIDDPWYTREFDECFNLVYKYSLKLYNKLKERR